MAAKVESAASLPKLLDLEAALEEVSRKRKSPPVVHNTKKAKTESVEPRTVKTSKKNGISTEEYESEDEEESFEELARQYKKFTNAPKFDLNSEELFCICRKPDNGELMVLCDGCDEWYHFKCMNLKKENSGLIAKFFCKFCQWKGTGFTLWKRKCRVQWCNEPARVDSNSKYCTDAHGKLFIKQLLVDREALIQDLKPEVVNDILTHVGDNYVKLKNLGSEFPELPEVTKLKDTGSNLSEFPDDTRTALTKVNGKLDLVNESIEQLQKRIDYLAKLKDKIKLANEKLAQTLFPDGKIPDSLKKSKKQTKLKKLDICLYDNSVVGSELASSFLSQLLDSQDLFVEFQELVGRRLKDELDDAEWYQNKICIQERRKCIRHNGWLNLVTDELARKMSELQTLLEGLELQKETILRDYSTRVYESK